MNIILDTLIFKTSFHDKVAQNFHDSMINIKEMMFSIAEAINISYHLQIQDEDDRKSIQLMGLTQNTRHIEYNKDSKKSPITIDEKCLSCNTGTANVILKAFKVACLTYKSSNVIYKSTPYSRLNLIDCLNKSASELKEKLYNKDFLKSELPDKNIGKSMRSINIPDYNKNSDHDSEFAIPWPKIDGSLPIQSPTSVAPRDMKRERSKSVFEPAIVDYKRRK